MPEREEGTGFMIDQRLLELLVCPQCKGSLQCVEHEPGMLELQCRIDGLAYPIRDGIPVMLVDEARVLDIIEREV